MTYPRFTGSNARPVASSPSARPEALAGSGIGSHSVRQAVPSNSCALATNCRSRRSRSRASASRRSRRGPACAGRSPTRERGRRRRSTRRCGRREPGRRARPRRTRPGSRSRRGPARRQHRTPAPGDLFGIGGALWGEITVQNGRVQQSNFHDYRVLRINEAPAIANAVFAATGKRIRRLPLEPQLRPARGETRCAPLSRGRSGCSCSRARRAAGARRLRCPIRGCSSPSPASSPIPGASTAIRIRPDRRTRRSAIGRSSFAEHRPSRARPLTRPRTRPVASSPARRAGRWPLCPCSGKAGPRGRSASRSRILHGTVDATRARKSSST